MTPTLLPVLRPLEVPVVPSEIRTAPEAVAALRAFLAWEPWPSGFGFDWPIVAPFHLAEKTLAGLDRDLGLGPVVRAVPDHGEPHLVGRTHRPPHREVLSLHQPSGPAPMAASTLAEVATGTEIAYALAARCSVLADEDSERGGRVRQVRQLRTEASELETFGALLEGLIPDLSEPFLAEWEARAARRGEGPTEPPPPVFIPAQLR